MVICSTKLRFNINRARCFVVVLAFTLSFLWVKASTPPSSFIWTAKQTVCHTTLSNAYAKTVMVLYGLGHRMGSTDGMVPG